MSSCSRRSFLIKFSGGTLAVALGREPFAASRERAGAASQPNFVFILIDDMGYADIGCYGSRFYETPNVDRLASQGMRFTNGYAACPVCSPTRLSIMTGKYPARARLTNYIDGNRWPDNSPILRIADWTMEMRPEETTIAETLRSAGYATACIGKWHLNSKTAERSAITQPDKQGFDFVVESATNRTDKSASAFTDKAIEFIQANKDRPFFLYLSHHSVHIPLQATPDLIEKYEAKIQPNDPQNNATYAGMVESVDRSVGRVMDTLDNLGLERNTVFVFFSDNGGLSVKEGPNTPATSNFPLRAGKGYLYEGGIREPLIVRWPGMIQAGSECAVPVSSVDFFPTFLEIAGLAAESKEEIDGESLVPLLKQTGELKRDAIFWHYPHYSNQGGLPSGAVRIGDFKLIEFYEDGRLELYNLREDSGEANDLAGSMPEKAEAMRQRLESWRQSVAAQMPARNPNHDPAKPLYSNPAKAPDSWKARAESPEKSVQSE